MRRLATRQGLLSLPKLQRDKLAIHLPALALQFGRRRHAVRGAETHALAKNFFT
jgi:hypothetical protein